MLLKKIMYKYMCRKLFWQGPKKVPSSGPGQIDFVAGQVTVKADLHNKQGSRQKSAKEIIKWEEQEVASANKMRELFAQRPS